MDKKDRIKIEITKNTLDTLLYKIDNYLANINTKKYIFQNKEQKENSKKAIKNFTYYRLKEKIIDENSKLWKVLIKLEKSNLESIKELESIYSDLVKIKEVPVKSIYYKQKGKEKSQFMGEKIISKFFRIFNKP